MLSLASAFQVFSGFSTGKSFPSLGTVSSSIQKLATDPLFFADIFLLSGIANSSYLLERSDGTVVKSGSVVSSNSDVIILDIPAYSAIDVLNAIVRLYGKKYYKVTVIHNLGGTQMFIAQQNDNNITEPNSTLVQAYPITMDYTAKTITTSGSLIKNQLYDFVKYSNALIANVNNTATILDTVDGINYILDSTWVLKLGASITGGFNLTGNVQQTALFTTSNFNLTGTWTFTVQGTVTFNTSTVSTLANTSAGVVTVNTSGSSFTTIGANINITASIIFTITDLIPGSIVGIYDNEVTNTGNNDTLLINTLNSGTSFSYTHSGVGNSIRVEVIKTGYVEQVIDFTLSSSNQSLPIKQQIDNN